MAYDIETKCLHLETRDRECDKSGAISFPIYQTATYAHPGLGESTGYDYSRLQNPTRAQVEKVVAGLEGGADTLGLPKYQTSCGIADILSHLLERYFSDVKNTDVTDYLIEGAVKALLVNAERLIKNPSDINARAEIQWLASIAHNNLLDTGRIGDWGSHRIEHELSAQYGLTHGEGMAVVLTAWTKYMSKEKPWKLAQLSSRVFGTDTFNYTEEESALILSEKLKEFFVRLGLKVTLAELNIGREHFNEMADRATKGGKQTVGHYIPLDSKRIEDILELAEPVTL